MPGSEESGSGVANAGGGSSGQLDPAGTDSDRPNQQQRAEASECRREARRVVEAHISDIAQLKDTVAQLSEVVIEIRDGDSDDSI